MYVLIFLSSSFCFFGFGYFFRHVYVPKKGGRACPLGIVSVPVLALWFLLAPGPVTVVAPTGMLERRGTQEDVGAEENGVCNLPLLVRDFLPSLLRPVVEGFSGPLLV